MTDYARFTTPDEFNDFLDQQDDRDDALDDAWAAYFADEENPVDQRKPWRWLIPAVDPDRAAFVFPEELHENKWCLVDEDGELLEDQRSEHHEVDAFIVETSPASTGR